VIPLPYSLAEPALFLALPAAACLDASPAIGRRDADGLPVEDGLLCCSYWGTPGRHFLTLLLTLGFVTDAFFLREVYSLQFFQPPLGLQAGRTLDQR